MKIESHKKGFTIIEVVLVLAIAGLIFLMVFVALPALQRSQRDTQRRDDMARFMTQLDQYRANNSGNVPQIGTTKSVTAWSNFITNYLQVQGDSFEDPDGNAYTIGGVCIVNGENTCDGNSASPKTPQQALTWDADKHQIYVYTNAKCNGEDAKYVANSPRLVAIRYKLEGAGVYCGNV